MEEVEEANRAAVEGCHKVLSLLSQPQDQVQPQYRNLLMVETGEAVGKFKKVVSLLNNGLGHARVRKLKRLQIPFPQSIFLDKDNPNCKTNHQSSSKSLQFPPQISFREDSIQDLRNSLSLGNPSLELSSNGKSPLQLTQQASSQHYHHFLKQQQQQQLQQQQQQQQRLMLHHQQQMKHQAEIMFRRNSSGINLNFDSSSCTQPTMSSTRSFISSLSVDGSVANMDGSAFHLIGAPHSSDQNSLQHKRKCSGRGDEGSVKCGSSSRCHCSKKRLEFFPLTVSDCYFF